MFAIVESGAKQYRLRVGEFFKTEKLLKSIGEKISLSNVMMIKNDNDTKIGQPFINGAKVECEVLSHGKNEKVLIFKKKRRKNHRRKNGHRQEFTCLKVLNISA